MKSFSNFKDYIFKHLFPYYYKDNDTYKDVEGKGILERFIDVCSEYFDTDIMPDIDNFMDILDVDKTPDIFLNYLWEYFGYIPYAYGILTKGEPYTRENVARWLNNPTNFPKADTRSILKYAISLYKIRGTDDFYNILGRFYGVRFEITETECNGGSSQSTLDDGSGIGSELVISTYNNIYSSYDDVKAGYRDGDCLSCIKLKVKVYIPTGIYELLEKNGNLENTEKAFKEIINKYIPVHAQICDEEFELVSSMTTIMVTSPPIVPVIKTQANLTLIPNDTLDE